MKGHTDRSTINQRTPMTRQTAALLKYIVANGRVSGHQFDHGDKSRARALMDRGYAMPDPAGWWEVTEAGRAAAGEIQ